MAWFYIKMQLLTWIWFLPNSICRTHTFCPPVISGTNRHAYTCHITWQSWVSKSWALAKIPYTLESSRSDEHASGLHRDVHVYRWVYKNNNSCWVSSHAWCSASIIIGCLSLFHIIIYLCYAKLHKITSSPKYSHFIETG